MVINFIKGKQYIFSKEEALKDEYMRDRYNAGNTKWIDECDQKPVEVAGYITGGVKVDDTIFVVVAEWCKEAE